MRDKQFEELSMKYELVSIPTDAIVDMWEDEIGLIRMTVGASPKTDQRLVFSQLKGKK